MSIMMKPFMAKKIEELGDESWRLSFSKYWAWVLMGAV
jgi:hypothetical protein